MDRIGRARSPSIGGRFLRIMGLEEVAHDSRMAEMGGTGLEPALATFLAT
jgi:hypothetical protein